MQSEFSSNLYFASGRAMIKVLEWLGDPLGMLESSSDMVAYAETLRTKSVHKSITGILITADYTVCRDVLKSPNWRTQLGAAQFIFPDSEKVDPFLDIYHCQGWG